MLKTVSSMGGGSGSGGNVTINTTPITGGTSGRVLYDNAGTVGELPVTGTGSVVLNNNPIFDTGITIDNGMTVGSGIWQAVFSSAFGFAALESLYGTLSNTGMTGIGYGALSSFAVGIATVTVTNGGSGYYDDGGGTDTFEFPATLDYVSGPTSSGIYPTATINVVSGVVTSATITNAGYGFPDTGVTVMTAVNPLGGGSGLLLSRNTFKVATNNTALGYNAGNTNYTGSNSVYLGYGATGTGSNQIVIGANAVGDTDNSVTIGDNNITSTTLKGTLNSTGSINFTGASGTSVNIGTAIVSGAITIGKTNGTGTITLGQSTATQTVNIHCGALGAGSKTLNLGTLATGGTTTINIGVATGTKTINIGTGSTTNPSTIDIGSGTPANSKVTLNGTVILSRTATPASATAAGVQGTISWDANYIYICTATNTWKRTAITTW
jgi:hypothetical protein